MEERMEDLTEGNMRKTIFVKNVKLITIYDANGESILIDYTGEFVDYEPERWTWDDYQKYLAEMQEKLGLRDILTIYDEEREESIVFYI